MVDVKVGRRQHDHRVVGGEPRAVRELLRGQHPISRRLAAAVEPAIEDRLPVVSDSVLNLDAQSFEQADHALASLPIGGFRLGIANCGLRERDRWERLRIFFVNVGFD